ncbi:unnamed protein product [Bursaphelenchus xylophilus]|uniref:Cyanate hydratase n=1 Tax=Bursaphelenchus xylophilus TaxID=6326 RepID=A0A1I7S7R6_BURXY|nr:unnamed protein product [Bursaphelenchus xylophilus]CAG9086894.1 unnamed protein product [Bursaphelenchus xylophilus]
METEVAMSRVITSRAEVTQQLLARKVVMGLKWVDVAKALGRSKEWTTAACLGQMQLTSDEAKAVVSLFDLGAECLPWLQTVPYKGQPGIPSDPALYRLYEALGVFGPAMKELIHEEFGDGIMSAIDFSFTVDRVEDPNGDRVKIVWNGKFLPYKRF